MADSLRNDFGVTVRWQESQSRTTWENATMTAAMLQPQGIKRVVVVTFPPIREKSFGQMHFACFWSKTPRCFQGHLSPFTGAEHALVPPMQAEIRFD